jgi:hypothetical protein
MAGLEMGIWKKQEGRIDDEGLWGIKRKHCNSDDVGFSDFMRWFRYVEHAGEPAPSADR